MQFTDDNETPENLHEQIVKRNLETLDKLRLAGVEPPQPIFFIETALSVLLDALFDGDENGLKRFQLRTDQVIGERLTAVLDGMSGRIITPS